MRRRSFAARLAIQRASGTATATIISWPVSTPTLNNSNAPSLASCGSPISENAESDHHFDGSLRQSRESQRSCAERDAVRDCEGGECADQSPQRGHEQDQSDDEEQVIDAAQDVFDAKHEVRRQHRPCRRELERRLGRLHHAGNRSAVGELGPDERRSQGSLQSSDPDRFSGKAARALGLPARNESTVGDFDVPFAERRAVGRQLRIDRDPSFRERGLLPGQRIDAVALLDDLQISRTNFVSLHRARKAQ
jgi:hypothetical protein